MTRVFSFRIVTGWVLITVEVVELEYQVEEGRLGNDKTLTRFVGRSLGVVNEKRVRMLRVREPTEFREDYLEMSLRKTKSGDIYRLGGYEIVGLLTYYSDCQYYYIIYYMIHNIINC